jgi:PAS domain S-box-containing protein
MGGPDAGDEALSERGELSALLDAFPDIGFVIDAEGTYREVLSSPESEELLYEDPEWLLGNTVHDVFPEDDADRLLGAIHESLEADELRTVEYQLDVPAGPRWFEARVHPLERGHDPPHAVFVARDVTDRRRYEREIERQRGYMQALLESTDDVFVVADVDGRIVDWNQRLLSVTGYTGAALDSMSVLDVFPSTDAETVRSIRKEVLETGREKTELDLATRDGGAVPHEFVVTLFEDRNGERLVAGIGREITERKRREEALQRRTEMLDGVIESLEDIFYVLDERGNVLRHNDTVQEVTGYDDEEISGMTAAEFFDEDDVEAVADAVYRGFAEGRSRVEANLVTRTGDRVPYEFVGNRIERYDGRRVLVGIGRDVRERKEREQQVRVFGRVLRHDIRNKLDIVRGATERIDGNEAATQRIRTASDELLATSEKAHEITELLLTGHSVGAVDLPDRIEGAAETCRSRYPAAAVDVDVDDVGQVEAIPEVRRAFVELIENGIVHDDGDHPRVEVSARVEDDAVVVTVDDEAPPIPASEAEVVTGTSPITPLKHGSGLGLWLVNWIVGRSGGSLGFETAEDGGTAARVRLPRHPETR